MAKFWVKKEEKDQRSDEFTLLETTAGRKYEYVNAQCTEPLKITSTG